MGNNYRTKHDTWKAIFRQPHKIHVGAAEKSSREYKGSFKGINSTKLLMINIKHETRLKVLQKSYY